MDDLESYAVPVLFGRGQGPPGEPMQLVVPDETLNPEEMKFN